MRIVFMGTPRAAVPSLERITLDGHEVVAVYTRPDRPAGRGNKITASPVKEAAAAHGVEVLQPTKIKTAEAIDTFRSYAADVVVVVAYGRILPETFLNVFTHGAVNVHFSLLPKYRGAAPVNWAIANGESVTGVTTMKMDAGLDTGPILLQKETSIGRSETAIELTERLAAMGADLLSKTLNEIGNIRPSDQEHANASYAPMLKKSDGLIDWNDDADTIANRVRGFQPFPTVFSYYNEKRLTMWAARESNVSYFGEKPGTLVDSSGGILRVGCGNGTVLEISELQPEGRRRMSAQDFINGIRLPEGIKFGD